jgi:hypothetical protein
MVEGYLGKEHKVQGHMMKWHMSEEDVLEGRIQRGT